MLITLPWERKHFNDGFVGMECLHAGNTMEEEEENEEKKNCHKTLHAKQSAKRPTSPPKKSGRFSRNSYRIHLEPFSIASQKKKNVKAKYFALIGGYLWFWMRAKWDICEGAAHKPTSSAYYFMLIPQEIMVRLPADKCSCRLQIYTQYTHIVINLSQLLFKLCVQCMA